VFVRSNLTQYERKIEMYKIRILAIALGVFGCVLLNSYVASAQIRTVLVSPVPGNPVASGTGLQNALAGISSPSDTNRWLLKIEPGIYDFQTGSLQMRSWVDIEGSGINVTTIRSSETTIRGASNAELRMLTVEAIGNQSVSPGPEVIAMLNQNAHPRVYRVKFKTQGSNSETWGMRNLSSAPKIEECEFSVSGGAFLAKGLTFVNFISTGERSSIVRSRIAVSGTGTVYGVWMLGGQTLTEMQETRLDVNGSHPIGIYALQGGWLGSEGLSLRNVELKAIGTGSSFGIFMDQNTTILMEVWFSKIEALGASLTKGIFQGGSPPLVIQNSRIWGVTKVVETTTASFSIQSSALFGGPTIGGGWNGCMGVWDENGSFYAHGCPQ
jgi:hypothetical protein